MKTVYLLKHSADDNDWIKVFKSLKSAKKELLSLLKEYENDGIKFDFTDCKTWYYNDWYSIDLTITKEKVR
jgi:uncharacterized protein YpuA (DUF1002 family)